MLLIDDLHIRVIHRHTGELIRELTLDPTRDYQPRGLPPGPPKRPQPHPGRHPDPGQPRHPQPGSRLAAGHPQGPGLDPGEDGATINSRDAETTPEMQRCLDTPVNGVPRHHMEPPWGIEPQTYALREPLPVLTLALTRNFGCMVGISRRPQAR